MKEPTKIRLFSMPGSKRVQRWMLLVACLIGLQSVSQAAKVLYVQNLSQRDTVKFINILKAQGHDVTVWTTSVNGNALTAAEYAAQGYQLLIVDEVISSGAVGGSFRNSPIPVINWEGFLYNGSRSAFNADSGLAGGTCADAAAAWAYNSGAGADFGQVISETNINVVLPSHPLAAGLPSGLVAVFDPNPPAPFDEGAGVISFIGTRTLVSGATVVATVPGFSNGGCIVGVDVGVTNYDNVTTNQARWVQLPWNDTDQQERVMVEPSFFLFEAGVAWALGLPQPTKIRNLLPLSASMQPTNVVVTFSVNKTNAAGSAVVQTNIHLKLNGVDMISTATIADGGTQWNVAYTNNALTLNTNYTIIASAFAADGGFSARLTQIDTFSQTNFMFEAEDFNYGGGSYFDSVVLCTNMGGGVPGCYFDRVGVTNIDEFEPSGTVTITTPLTNEVYRFGSGVTREEFIDTYLTADTLLRQKYIIASIPDYEIRNATNNEWLNYTRTFPSGYFNVYARVASAASMTTQMDWVTNSTATNQTLSKIGRFVRSAGTTGYEMVPLTDDSGTVLTTVEFDNTPRTVRMTAINPGFTPNFYMLIPTTAPPNTPPTVGITGPTNGAVLSEAAVTTISATASDPDGSITNVEFYAGILGATGSPTLLGSDNTSPYSFAWTPPKLGTLGYYTIQVGATDNRGLTIYTNIIVKIIPTSLSIVTTADGNGADSELRENDGSDSANGTGPSMNVRITIATGTTNRHEVIGLRFNFGSTNLADIGSVALNMVSYRALAARTIHLYGVTNGTVGLDNGTNGTWGYTDNNWAETNTTFSTMPGLVWDGQEETRGLTNVMDLGTLNIAKQKGEVWSISSPQLLTFLRGNPDNIVTFLLEQDDDNTGQSRFATKEAVALDGNTPAMPPGTTNWFAPFVSFTLGRPTLNVSPAGNAFAFSWVGAFKLQVQTNDLSTGIGANWVDYPGGTSPVTVPIDANQGTVFFRLISL